MRLNNAPTFQFTDIERFFPFNFVVSSSMQITHWGPSLLKVFGYNACQPCLTEIFLIRKPFGFSPGFDELQSSLRQLFVLEFRNFQTVFLQGEFVMGSTPGEVVFLGNLWLTDTRMLQKMNLNFSDFSFTSTLPDTILKMDTVQSMNTELTTLTEELYVKQKALEEKSYIADKIIHPILVLSDVGKIVWANEAFLKNHQVTMANISGMEFTALLQKEMAGAENIALIKNALENRMAEKMECSFVDSNGKLKWVDMEIQPIIGVKGNLEKYIVLIKNITTEKRYELSLKKSEDNYKYIVDNVSDIIFQTDTVGNWTFLNNAWEQIMHYSIKDTVGTVFFNYLHKEDVEKNAKLFQPLIERKKEYCRHAIRYVAKNGEIKWMQVFAKLIFNEKGEIAGTSGTLKDITTEMQNQHIFNVMLNNISDVVCLLNLEGKIKYLSPSFQKLTGYTAAATQDKNIYDFIHKEDKLLVMRKFRAMKLETNNTEYYYTFRFKYADGTYKWIESNASIFNDEFYVEDSILASVREIDHRKKAEILIVDALKKEKELSELKSQFVQITSHEFRNPLAIIQSSVELMDFHLEISQQQENDNLKRHIDGIKKEVDRLTYLMNEILLFGKIENNGIALKLSPVSITEVFKRIADRNIDKLFNGRTLEVCITGEERLVNADPILIEHILDNLVNNAFKYSAESRNPLANIEFGKEAFKIHIQDFGIGIPEADVAKLYSPFHRGQNVNLIKGTGMGLAIVKRFVELHNGTIECTSELLKGTTFTITISY